MQTFVFIHGASHGAWCWSPLIEWLEAPAFTIDLPGRGKRPADLEKITVEDYAASAVNDIKSLDAESIILVGHSMAGVTLPRVADQIPELISRMVFVSCAVPPDGKCLLDLLDPPPQSQEAIDALTGDLLTGIPEEQARYIFCNDMNDAQAQFVVDRIDPESPRLLTSGSDLRGLRHPIPHTYIRLAQDQALPLSAQNISIESIGDAEVVDLDTGHNVMISNPKLLADILNQYV